MPRNSEVTIFNTYETTICIRRKYSIQNPIIIKECKELKDSEYILKNLSAKNIM